MLLSNIPIPLRKHNSTLQEIHNTRRHDDERRGDNNRDGHRGDFSKIDNSWRYDTRRSYMKKPITRKEEAMLREDKGREDSYSIISDEMSTPEKRVHHMNKKEPRFTEKARIIGVIEVDSLECQIWRQQFPYHAKTACVVADENQRIVSVSAEAKARGVTINHQVPHAKVMCPKLKVFIRSDPFTNHAAADTVDVMKKAAESITEAISAFLDRKDIANVPVRYWPPDCWFFDLTNFEWDIKRMRPIEYSDRIYIENGIGRQKGTEMNDDMDTWEKKSLIGAAFFLLRIKDEIFDKTLFTCTGGVASNLLQATIACNHNKPGGVVTVLTSQGFDRICQDVPINTVRGFTEEFSEVIKKKLRVSSLAELRELSSRKLKRYFQPRESEIIFKIARGICEEIVAAPENIEKPEICCSKENLCIKSDQQLQRHLNDLSGEMLYKLNEERVRRNREPLDMKIIYGFTVSDEVRNEHWEELIFVYVQSQSHRRNNQVAHLAQRSYQAITGQKKGINFQKLILNTLKLIAMNFREKASCNQETKKLPVRRGERNTGQNDRQMDELHRRPLDSPHDDEFVDSSSDEIVGITPRQIEPAPTRQFANYYYDEFHPRSTLPSWADNGNTKDTIYGCIDKDNRRGHFGNMDLDFDSSH